MSSNTAKKLGKSFVASLKRDKLSSISAWDETIKMIPQDAGIFTYITVAQLTQAIDNCGMSTRWILYNGSNFRFLVKTINQKLQNSEVVKDIMRSITDSAIRETIEALEEEDEE